MLTTVSTGRSGSSDLLGGADLLQLLVLAVGGALVVGNGLALVRPPAQSSATRDPGQQVRAPLGRSVTMIVVGLIAVIWAIASLTA